MGHEYYSTVDIIVPCKGRLHHLQRTIDSMLAQASDLAYSVVVVDYGCPQGTFDFCIRTGHPRLTSLRVLDNTEPFNVARARNIGARNSKAEIYCFLDADCQVHPEWLSRLTDSIFVGNADAVVRCRRANRSGFGGICAVQRDFFHEVRGYDEGMQGWGFEDVDFYRRLMETGRSVHMWREVFDYVTPIHHCDEERIAHYEEKDRWKSHERNYKMAQQDLRVVNSDGYGNCRLLAFP